MLRYALGVMYERGEGIEAETAAAEDILQPTNSANLAFQILKL